jgi:hypothetical protein
LVNVFLEVGELLLEVLDALAVRQHVLPQFA